MKTKRLTAELAAYAHVDALALRGADRLDVCNSPMWHGWAVREAFVAGAKWQAAANLKRKGKVKKPAPSKPS